MRLPVLLCLGLFISVAGKSQQTLNLVPWPAEITEQEGTYQLPAGPQLRIASNIPGLEKKPLYSYLKSELQKNFPLSLTRAVKGKDTSLYLLLRRDDSGKPSYTLQVDKKGIRIEANSEEAVFHAIQTLFQLLENKSRRANLNSFNRTLPFVRISDRPRFNYRGMHLDVSRHFFPVSFIKRYIDYLAYHKLNRFHWHLTDDQGWRIEIKKYPRLTSVGSWRNGTLIGRYPGMGNDNTRYGGFYTQAEIREVVNYARDRFIDVIPEIEMPGHGSAAIAAYPGLSCFPAKPTAIPPNMISRKSVDEQQQGRIKLVQETWGVFEDVFCAGSDSTFHFLQNVIDEVIALFPSKYFHIGGDECPKTHWKQCPRCQQRMKEHNLKDEHELQSYFVQRIEKYLNSKGRTLIGWDEILEGGLAPNAVVMSWRGEAGGIEAARQKHQVIMTPGNPVYFDHTQSQNEDSVTIGGYNPLEKVYAYEPIPPVLSAEQGKFILGAQANLWTEYIKNTSKVEYMLFPRLAALSEVLWSPKENRDWAFFEKRLPGIFNRYRSWNAHFSRAYYQPIPKVRPGLKEEKILWHISHKYPDGVYLLLIRESGAKKDTIPYGNMPGMEFTVPIMTSGKYTADTYNPGAFFNKTVPRFSLTQQFHFNKATGKPIRLKEEASSKYPGDGAFTLVNGVQNEKGFDRAGEFLGFEGKDCEAIIDLGEATACSEIVIHTLERPGSWIWFPAAFDISLSSDSVNFSPPGTGISILRSTENSKFTLRFQAPVTTRYIRLLIKNHGPIAAGQPGAGNRAWLFVDEIEVN